MKTKDEKKNDLTILLHAFVLSLRLNGWGGQRREQRKQNRTAVRQNAATPRKARRDAVVGHAFTLQSSHLVD